jgi:hypothetical protein
VLNSKKMKAPEDSPTEETSHPIQEESDPVWKLLSAEFRRNPAPSSEWFAVRTVAKAMAGGQIQAETTWFSRNLRWLLPLPLAASLGIALLAIHRENPLKEGNISPSSSFVSSQEEFEEHMELLAYSE